MGERYPDRVPQIVRLHCCIAGCGRSTRRVGRLFDADEYLCDRHWSRVDPRYRRVHNRHRRLARLIGEPLRKAAAARIWRRCKRQAARPPFGGQR